MNVSKDLTMGGNGCWCTPDNFITKAWAEARPRAEPGAWRRVTLRASASVIGPALLLMLSTFLKAQETSSPATNTQEPEPSKKEERSTGLPKQAKWTFNFDAAWGTFGFGNSLYTDVRPDPSGNLIGLLKASPPPAARKPARATTAKRRTTAKKRTIGRSTTHARRGR